METKRLSEPAQQIIAGYRRMRIGTAETTVPYFNNKTVRARMSLRAYVGKGSPKDIREEAEAILVKQHISPEALTADMLSRILADSGLGVDCSAFAYYILDAESRTRGLGHMNRRLRFIRTHGPLGRMFSYLRPAENCDVKTLASDMNSRIVTVNEAKPGDLITMTDGPDGADRNHALVINEIDREGGSAGGKDGTPLRLRYVHAVAYPEDGRYGTGIKEGVIEVAFPDKAITDQVWSESGSNEKASIIFARAKASKTELRRMKWLS